MKNLTKVLIVVLCLVLLAVAAVSCGTPKETTGGDDTTTNTPETTGTPDETQPDETQPDETQPDETQPDETQPDETQPDETQPDETQPDETLPDETQPDETEPEETEPEETQPVETDPVDPDHVHTYSELYNAPTCEADGVYVYICSCGDTYEEAGAAASGHYYVLTETIDATCLKTGAAISKCQFCGAEEVEILPLVDHKFDITTMIVEAETEDGVGFELVACSSDEDCKLMTKIDGNHAKGHSFGLDGTCVCGAKSLGGETINLGKVDFTDEETQVVDGVYTFVQGDGISFSYRNDKAGFSYDDNGWLASAYTGSGGVAMLDKDANSTLVALLKGEYEDKMISPFTLSFTLYYEGTAPALPASAGDRVFIGMRETVHTGNQLEIKAELDGGKPVLVGPAASVTLEEKTTYTLAMSFDVGAKKITVTLNAADSDAITIAELENADLFNSFQRIVFRCGSSGPFHTTDTSAFKLYIDSFAIGYIAAGDAIDDTTIITENLCDHVFEVEALDATQYTHTCTKCGRYYVGALLPMVKAVTDEKGLSEALAAGGNIVLGADVTLTANELGENSTIEIREDVVINLNGYDLDLSASARRPFELYDGADLTINASDETITVGHYGLVYIPEGASNVTLNGGNYVGETDKGSFIKPKGEDAISIVLNGVNYTDSSVKNWLLDAFSYEGEELTITINGGTYNVVEGVGAHCANITIDGTELNVKGVGVEAGTGCTATITGSTINVANGTFNAAAPNVCVAASDLLGLGSSVTVENCILTSDFHIFAIYSGDNVTINATVCTIEHTGEEAAYKVYNGYKGVITVDGNAQ